jgi:hypothetical protein
VVKTTDHRISAQIVAASRGYHDMLCVTWRVRGPWVIWPEVLTHRELSRNCASLRAIPQAKLIEAVRSEPFFFAHLGLMKPGMQALEDELEGVERRLALMWWDELAQDAAHYAEKLAALGLHKQTCNRALMPFLYFDAVITATSREPGGWPCENFFGLRAKSSKVEPHMHEIAWVMADAFAEERARGIGRPADGLHLPFVTPAERVAHKNDRTALQLASSMRCARVSYLKLDGAMPSIVDDAARAREALMAPGDLHGSPFEHAAEETGSYQVPSGNFRGWSQFRKGLDCEYTRFNDDDYAVGRKRVLQPGISIDWKDA